MGRRAPTNIRPSRQGPPAGLTTPSPRWLRPPRRDRPPDLTALLYHPGVCVGVELVRELNGPAGAALLGGRDGGIALRSRHMRTRETMPADQDRLFEGGGGKARAPRASWTGGRGSFPLGAVLAEIREVYVSRLRCGGERATVEYPTRSESSCPNENGRNAGRVRWFPGTMKRRWMSLRYDLTGGRQPCYCPRNSMGFQSPNCRIVPDGFRKENRPGGVLKQTTPRGRFRSSGVRLPTRRAGPPGRSDAEMCIDGPRHARAQGLKGQVPSSR